jgi:hypothetical protein
VCSPHERPVWINEITLVITKIMIIIILMITIVYIYIIVDGLDKQTDNRSQNVTY